MNKKLAQYWQRFQPSLFETLRNADDERDGMSQAHLRVMLILDAVEIERFVYDPALPSGRGRPLKSRTEMARAFVAKAVLKLPTTRSLIDRLKVDGVLRRLLGFKSKRLLPCEATFSNAFAAFASDCLPETVHAALIKEGCAERVILHISRDATDIPTRVTVKEKAKRVKAPAKLGRPSKGEVRIPERRLERQLKEELSQMLSDLPQQADCGSKRGYSWKGYKLHLDVADGGIPVAALLTSASLHDSQVAIPLEELTSRRVVSLYSLMDSAYDAKEIRTFIALKGKVPLIAPHNRQGQMNFLCPAAKERFKERTTAERANARLKDDFGARYVRVRGAAKVMAHLMYGVLALSAEQLLRRFA